MRNVSNAARRTHDRTGGQVYFPASQDIAGQGSGGRTSRPTNGEWAALLVASGPGPLLGKNSGGATATHGGLLPRVIPSAAPGFEEAAADRGRVCHRQRYCQPGVYRGNWRWPKLPAAQVYGSGGFRCGRRTGHASRGPPGPLGALWVRAAATSVPQARVRVAGAQHRAGFPRARNGAGFDGHHALFFVPLGWLSELPPGLERGVKVILAHRIELDPTEKQKEYFRQACGTARFVWNWALELSIRLRCKHRCLRDQAVLQLLQVRGVPLAEEHSSGRSRPTFRRFR